MGDPLPPPPKDTKDTGKVTSPIVGTYTITIKEATPPNPSDVAKTGGSRRRQRRQKQKSKKRANKRSGRSRSRSRSRK